jgi:hypothetical protein
VIATGGTWDRTDRPIYFLAGPDHHLHVGGPIHPYVLVALNELTLRDPAGDLERVLDTGAQVLLDSGVFAQATKHARRHHLGLYETLALPPEQLDGWDRLLGRYISLVKRFEHRLWGYVELDQGGRDRKRATRRTLEGHGLRPMPVYHPLSDGLDYLQELAEGYDRICAANLVKTPRAKRLPLLHSLVDARRRYPHLWVHLLGVTPDQDAFALDAGDSMDSSTWESTLRYPAGYKEHAAGRALPGTPTLPTNYKSRLGKGHSWAPDGMWKAVQMGAVGAAARHANWRHYRARLADLGLA